MQRYNKETEAVNDFHNFLRTYFRDTKIERHPDCPITVTGNKKPDFLIKINKKQKIIFEFKELKKSQKENSHRDKLIKREFIYDTRPIPNTFHIYMFSSVKKAMMQLACVELLKCPGVLVLYSKFAYLRRYGLNRHNRYTTIMYKQNNKSIKNRIPTYISAIAYFSLDTGNPHKVKYRIRFYHNIFAKYKLDFEPFDDKKCQHYFIDNELF